MAQIVINSLADVKMVMEAFRNAALGDEKSTIVAMGGMEPLMSAIITLADEALAARGSLVKLPGGSAVAKGDVSSVHIATIEMEPQVVVTTKQGVKIVVLQAAGKSASQVRDEVVKLLGL